MEKEIIEYITNNFDNDDIKSLEKLSSFIEQNKYKLTIIVAKELIEQSIKLNKCLNNIFTKQRTRIFSLYHLGDALSILFIAYAELKDIDLNKILYGSDSAYEENNKLIAKIQSGDEKAKELLIKNNEKLVWKIAAYYSNAYKTEIEDLISEGYIGLLIAAEKFDLSLNNRFSTYATYWIKYSIARYCENNYEQIRIPNATLHLLFRYNRFRTTYIQEYGNPPSYQECAKALGLSVTKVKYLSKLNPKIEHLETKINEDKDSELGDFIADNRVKIEEDILDDITNKNIIKVLSEVLSEKEKHIIMARYGFLDRVYTLEEIGQKYGVSRERIRQIEERVLKILKKPKVLCRISNDDLDSFSRIKEKGILQYFPHSTLLSLKNIIRLLPINQYNLVIKIFGTDLSTFSEFNDKELDKFNKVIFPNIKRLLANKTIISDDEGLFELFPNNTKEEIINAVCKLPNKQLELIKLKYGDDFDENNILVDNDSDYLISVILPNISQLLLRKQEISRAFMDFFPDNTKEEIIALIETLPVDKKQFIYDKYGVNLDESHSLIKGNYIIIKNLVNYLTEKLKYQDKYKYINKLFPNYSYEEIKEAINKLPTRQRQIALAKLGENLDEYNMLDNYYDEKIFKRTIINNINKLLQGKEIIYVDFMGLTLLEILAPYTQEEILNGLSELPLNEQRILTSKYGANLNEVNTVLKKANMIIPKLIKKLTKIIDKNRNKVLSIYEILGISKFVIDKRIKELSTEEKELLYAYFGYDLENPVRVELDEKTKKYVENVIFTKLRQDSKDLELINQIKTIINELHNQNILINFSIDEILVGFIYQKLISEDISLDYILKLLNISEEEFNNIINNISDKNHNGLSAISNVINAYIMQKQEKSWSK